MANKRPYQDADQGGYETLKKYWKKHGWKKREISYLKKNYKNKTDAEMVEEFLHTRTPEAIASKRAELGLKKAQAAPKKWTPEEEEILKQEYKNYTRFELANDLLPNKSPEQIRDKVHKMGLSKGKWTDEDVEKLVKVGGKFNSKIIAAFHLPNKTAGQIRGKLKYLGISRKKIAGEQIRRKDRLERAKARNKRKILFNKIHALREKGQSFDKISKELKKSPSTISTFYRKNKKTFLKNER